MQAFAIDSATSESLINILAKEIFARHGLPTSIHADIGSQFISEEFKTFLDSCSISLTHSFKYKPRRNGQNDRYNGELQRVMTRILRENGLKPDDWEIVVGESLFILRSRICEATGKLPHDMFFNVQRRIFANSNDLDSLEAPQIVKNRDLKRGSHVLNFVRHRKTDPFVKERGVVTDISSPQSAEVTVDGRRPEVINLRHLAPAPTR